jgi:hypothetical protein
MKRFRFILILSFISTAYLFSQIEGNEIIKTDTVITIDSVVATKIDTTDVLDTLIIKREKISIISIGAGTSAYTAQTINDPIISFAIRSPISSYFHLLMRYSTSARCHSFSPMIGFSIITGKSIIDISSGFLIMSEERKIFNCYYPSYPNDGKKDFTTFPTMDISYRYRFSKNGLLSISIDTLFLFSTNFCTIELG